MPVPDDRVGCLFALLKLFSTSPRLPVGSPDGLPYRLRDDFLSPAEQAFYRVLVLAAADRWLVFPKVRVADVLFVQQGRGYMTHQNRIDRKHLDFVLCDRQSLRPVAAVELDDASHGRPDRQARDAFVAAALAAAGLPLVRAEVRRAYTPQELAQTLAAAIDRTATVPPIASPSQSATTPTCPKCGVPMVERDGRRGRFFGCPNFPRCRETAPATPTDARA